MLDSTVELLSLYISNPYIIIILISMIPIIESRGSIPYGILVLDLPWYNVVFVSIIANFAVTIPIVYLLEPISKYFRKFYISKKFFNWVFSRSERKGTIINRLKLLGLIIFIGIPLPITGAWTGCVAANVFRIKKSYTLIGVFLGILLSVMIITALTLTGQSLGFEWSFIFIGVGLVFVVVFLLIFNKRDSKV